MSGLRNLPDNVRHGPTAPERTISVGAAALILLCVCGGLQAAGETPLTGCWRMQHRQEFFVDGRTRDVNTDCVFDYGATRVYSRCHIPNADSERLYAYQIIGPERMRVTPLDPASGASRAAASEIAYRIDSEWLVTTQTYDKSASDKGQQPERITTLWIRSSGEPACKPRGDSGLRVGNNSVSSLAFGSPPPGWSPLLVDPNSDKSLGLAVNRNFLIGAFVPEPGSSSAPAPLLVIVLDDFRYGARPIREVEFRDVKRRFASELGNAQLTCDLPERVCAFLRQDTQLIYTELMNIHGRVAVVHAIGPAGDARAEELLAAVTKSFIERLRRDNTL
jgi:hypothetical protein